MPEGVPILRVIRASTPDAVYRLRRGSTRIGRAPSCAISIADPGLSREHFDIQWDDRGYSLVDLDSRNGVQLRGKRVFQATLTEGDEILAGGVTFRLEMAAGRLADPSDEPQTEDRPAFEIRPIYASAEASLSPAGPAPKEGTPLADLTMAFRSSPDTRLYALIDGAQAFDLAYAGRIMGHDLYTLFAGDLADAAARVGPCLVALGDPSAFLFHWVERLGDHVGALFEASGDVIALGAHLRHLFVSTDEEGQEYFFRFYDPRVLRVFLPSCHEEELKDFFGPVLRWVVEDEAGEGFVTYSLAGGTLARAPVGPPTQPTASP